MKKGKSRILRLALFLCHFSVLGSLYDRKKINQFGAFFEFPPVFYFVSIRMSFLSYLIPSCRNAAACLGRDIGHI